MTALAEYQRLEATAIWHATPDAQRRDVILSIGDATLTITDHRDQALAHWSLAAVERLNPGKRPAIFAPGLEAPERLEVTDNEMVRAIERVRRAVARGRPHPGRVRTRLVLAGFALLIAAGVVWLPDALIRYTASIVPQAARAAIGRDLMDEVSRVSGTACTAPDGVAALEHLAASLGDYVLPNALVMPSGVRGTTHLPGGVMLMNRSVVEDHETPVIVAGYMLAEAERAAQTDPLLALLRYAGVTAALRLITTGALPEAGLEGYAEHLLTTPRTNIDQAQLIDRFAAANIPATPYAFAVDISGESTLRLIEADPVAPAPAKRLLTDGQWVALQNICGE